MAKTSRVLLKLSNNAGTAVLLLLRKTSGVTLLIDHRFQCLLAHDIGRLNHGWFTLN